MCVGALQHTILVAQLEICIQGYISQMLSIQLHACTATAAADSLQAQCMIVKATINSG